MGGGGGMSGALICEPCLILLAVASFVPSFLSRVVALTEKNITEEICQKEKSLLGLLLTA